MTEQSEHLSSAQIENYGIRTSGAGPEAAQRDEHQRADQRMADKLSDDQSAADQSMIDQRSNDQRTSDQDTSDQRIEAHLADCASCRNRLLEFHRSLFASPTYQPEPDRTMAEDPKAEDPKSDHTDSALADSKSANPKDPADPQVRTAATPECPSDDALRQLAAGLTPDDAAAKLTQHAATCNHCGPLLRTYTEIFSDDFSPEEQAALANLQSSSADWQKNTAREMLEAAATSAAGDASTSDARAADKQSSQQKSIKGSTKTTAGRRPFFWKWVLVPATAAIVAVAAFSIWYTQRDTPEKAAGLLAQAYTEQRTMAVRWPGAKWGPVSNILGDETTPKPLALLEADEIIGRHQKQSQDADWIRVLAERKIIDGDLQAAITLLDGVLRSHPDSVSLLQILAIAYFQLGERSHSRQDYQKTAEILSDVLRREPSNRVALFNRALAYERLNASGQAEKEWTAFLSAEKEEHWSGEAKKRSEDLRKLK